MMHCKHEANAWERVDEMVRAGTDGFIRAVDTAPGSQVTSGQVVVETTDPELTARVKILRGREAELNAKLESVRFSDRVEAVVTGNELSAVRTERAIVEQRGMLLNAPARTDRV